MSDKKRTYVTSDDLNFDIQKIDYQDKSLDEIEELLRKAMPYLAEDDIKELAKKIKK